MADDDYLSDTVRVTLPANMAARIDAQVGGDFAGREDFILAAIRHYLEYEQPREGSGPTAS